MLKKAALGMVSIAAAGLVLTGNAMFANAEDAVAKKAPAKRLPRCFVDKDGNGKCDKSVADGGKCKKNHTKPAADADTTDKTVTPADDAKKAGGGKTSLILCPGQGLCLACGLCTGKTV